jgi:hypothetical protein
MKKLSILFVFAALSLSTVSFAGDKDKDKSCAKDKKSCCKAGGSEKACAKGSEAKSCSDKETKSSNEAAPKK